MKQNNHASKPEQIQMPEKAQVLLGLCLEMDRLSKALKVFSNGIVETDTALAETEDRIEEIAQSADELVINIWRQAMEFAIGPVLPVDAPAIQVLFEVVGAGIEPAWPFGRGGKPLEADGVKFLTLNQAASKFKLSADELRADFRSRFSKLIGENILVSDGPGPRS